VKNSKTIFYTCPADAIEYNDTNGILSHYENMLKINGDKEWIWIFNCDRMELKHSMEFNTAIGILKIISEKYMHNIKQIYFINSTTIPLLINKLEPFPKIEPLIVELGA
jgi:hypothetical protein